MNGRGHVVDLLGAYALDALDETEAALVRAHLAECASCRGQLAGLAEAAGRLAELKLSDPPPQLRGRVLAAVEEAHAEPIAAAAPPATRPVQRNWVRWAQGLAAVALVASQVWLIATLLTLRAQLALQSEVQTILLSSNETPVDLKPPDPTSIARGVYHYEPDLQRGLINYYHLAPPGPVRSYQCWLEFASQPMVPCGRLTLDDQGVGLLLLSWSDSAPSRIRVTLETGSSATPLGPTVLLGTAPP